MMFNGKQYEFNGEMLSVKIIAGKVSLASSTLYKYLNNGLTIYEAVDKGKRESARVFNKREKTNNIQSKKYLWKEKERTVIEISKMENISKESLYRRLKKGMSVAEAVEEIKRNIAPKYPFYDKNISKYQISKITGVPKFYLDYTLLDNKTYTKEAVMVIINDYKKAEILMVGEETLLEHCIRNSYNYNVIYYGIKFMGLSIEESISQYVINGQNSRFRYIYTAGNVLLYHFLLKYKLDDRYVTYKIRKGRTVEEAIGDAIFLSKENYKDRTTRDRLRAIVEQLGSIDDLPLVKDEYGLSDDDIAFIIDKVRKIEHVLYMFKMHQIMGEIRLNKETINFEDTLLKYGVTVEELEKVAGEIYEGFAELEVLKGKEIKYVWRKGM
jgi:hypothetical protein